jgi:hypothetical protein
VEIHVLQGERELARDNKSLGHFPSKVLPRLLVAFLRSRSPSISMPTAL